MVGLLTAELLHTRHPDWDPAKLSLAKHDVVRTRTFAGFARLLGIPPALRLGVGEARQGGRDKDKVLEDAFEAVVGAVYLDGGLEAVRAFVLPLLEPALCAESTERKDAKSQLQERVQAVGLPPPRYAFDPP